MIAAKPLIKRPGGKTKLLRHILPMLADAPHETYCEPFFGGGAVFFAKPPARNEIINDLYSALFNFYLAVKHHPQELMRELRCLPKSRELFFHHRRILTAPDSSPVQRAAAYLYCNKHSFGADGLSFGVMRTSLMSSAAFRRLIPSVSRRLDRVLIECLDACRCIRLYDSPGTLFFVDPPYTAGESKAYALFTAADMAALAETLRSIKGRFVLTVNDSPANRVCFSGIRYQCIESKYHLDKQKTRTGKCELIITNLPFSRLSLLP